MSSYVNVLYLVYSPKYKSALRVAIRLDVNSLVGGWDAIEYWAEYAGVLLAELPSHYREEHGELVLLGVDKIDDIILKND